MKPALKKKWVDALLSGEYKQGRERLYENGRYCCLGVLDKVATGKVRDAAFLRDEHDNIFAFGLNEDKQVELSILNDFGVPFDMIAGLIDEAL